MVQNEMNPCHVRMYQKDTGGANQRTSLRAAAGSRTEQNTKVDTTASKDPDSKGSSSATPPTPRSSRPSFWALAAAFSRASEDSPSSAGSTPTERVQQGGGGEGMFFHDPEDGRRQVVRQKVWIWLWPVERRGDRT